MIIDTDEFGIGTKVVTKDGNGVVVQCDIRISVDGISIVFLCAIGNELKNYRKDELALLTSYNIR